MHCAVIYFIQRFKIKEIFESIQGEGLYIGSKQLFIRFCACNLKCKYCDTPFLPVNINDKDSFISRITASEADQLIEDGFIGGGMLPKLNNCTSAVKEGVNRVHILDGRIPHCLLLEIFTNEGVGTAIVRDED